MSTLKVFSEKERAYHADHARQNVLREQQSIRSELEDAPAARAVTVRDTEDERQAKDEALAPRRGRASQSPAARQGR